MFLEKYLNSTYLDLVYDNYDENYIEILDENNFAKVYNLLKINNFYFVEDIILNYLELFELDYKYIYPALMDIHSKLGNNYVEQIGKNMTYINEIIDLAMYYSENDE